MPPAFYQNAAIVPTYWSCQPYGHSEVPRGIQPRLLEYLCVTGRNQAAAARARNSDREDYLSPARGDIEAMMRRDQTWCREISS